MDAGDDLAQDSLNLNSAENYSQSRAARRSDGLNPNNTAKNRELGNIASVFDETLLKGLSTQDK